MLVMNKPFSCQDGDNIMIMITLSYENDPAQPKVGILIADWLVNAEVPKTCIPLFDQQGPPKIVAKRNRQKTKAALNSYLYRQLQLLLFFWFSENNH